MNKVFLSGLVGINPEIKEKIATFTFATTEKVKEEYKTEWHKIVIFGESRIKFVKERIKKGKALSIVGSIHYEPYEKDGKKMYATRIIAESIEFAPKEKETEEHEAQIFPKKSEKIEELKQNVELQAEQTDLQF